jgi:peptidoglycan/xylan/chitin deacetylase (PgdA/CDA1 family)
MSFLLHVLLILAILFSGLYLFWRVRLKTASSKSIQILTYHKINDDFDWGMTRQKVSQFEKGIEFLRDQGYETVTLEEACKPTPTNGDELRHALSRKVVITFDDGYEDVYLNAFPILQKYDFTAFIFMITGFVGKRDSWDYNPRKRRRRHLSWEQIRELCEFGFGFGSHTVNHPDLTRIEPRFVGYELKKSKDVLEDKLGKEVCFLSYPFGKYNRFVQEEAERTGYKRAYTLCFKNEEDGSGPFAQKRWGIYLFDSPLTLKMKLKHNGLFGIEDLKGRIINRFASGTAILKGSPDYREAESESIRSERLSMKDAV